MRMPCAAAVPAQMEATRIDNSFMFRGDEVFRSFHSASDLYSYSETLSLSGGQRCRIQILIIINPVFHFLKDNIHA